MEEVTTRPSRRSLLVAGARDTLPMLIGAAPFGVIFGTLVASGPLAPWQGQLMSATVFAGSSQLIALGLAGSASLIVIWFTTFVVNLRHMLYGATLLPHVAHLPRRWRWLLGFLLTDETFAVVIGRFGAASSAGQPAPPSLEHWYFLGSGLSMFLDWNAWTLVGLLFGAAFPGLQHLGLDFAMVVTFLAIVVPQLGRLPQLAAAITAGGLALLFRGWPYQLGLLGAVAAAVVVGVTLGRRRA
jgi:branched chain amino acid efflux pump